MIAPIEVSPASVPGQIKLIRITQSARKQVVLLLTDDFGAPVNLSEEVQNPPAGVPQWDTRNADGANVEIRLRVQAANQGELYGNYSMTVKGTILDQTTSRGFVSFQLENKDTCSLGIFEASIQRYIPNGNEEGWLVDTWPVLLAIEPSAMGLLSISGHGPLLIPEIRLALLDVDNQSDGAPFSNLLDDTEFTDLDIVFAQRRVVQMWNETPPNVRKYTTQNFPYRYWWLEGTCAHLLKMSAARYRRNRLAYQAGGVSIDDQSKAAEYEEAGQRKLSEFMEWMRQEKYRININACWSIGI